MGRLQPPATEVAPDWALGYPLAELKSYSGLFRSAHSSLVFGAFGIPKERDIATAMAAGRMFVNSSKDEVHAAAIVKKLGRPSIHHDFTGRQIEVSGWYMSDIAAVDENSGTTMVEDIIDRHAMLPMWAEVFEEDKVAKNTVQLCRFQYAFTKVSAGSEVKGVYVLGAAPPPPLPPVEEITLCLLQHNFISPANLRPLVNELAKLDPKYWTQHYSSYNKGGTWEALALRGYDSSDPTFVIKPPEMSRKWRQDNRKRLNAQPADTSLYKEFSAMRRLVESIPGRKDRVRLMRLAKNKGELTRHADITDREAGVGNGRVTRLHIPLITNDKVVFRSWDSRGKEIRLTPPEVSLMYLDQRKPHAVTNGGDLDRVHLVVDVFSGPELRGWLAKGYVNG